MTKSSKILPEAIKKVVNQYGIDVIKDYRLVNILNDLISYSESPASKAILREMLKNDFGNKILAIDPRQTDWRLRIDNLISEVSAKYGYRKEIVDYIISSVVYGIGWVTICPKYSQEEPNNNIDIVKNSFLDLQGELVIQKNNYIQLLEKLITIPDNYSGYYSASALSDLYFVEGKIHLLNKALNYNDDNWCQQEKQRVLQKYYKDTTKAKETAYVITAIIAFIAIAVGAYLLYFMATYDDRKAYNQLWQDCQTLYNDGNYEELISKYHLVFDQYSSFCSRDNKNEALSKLYTICEKIISDSRTSNIAFDKAVKIIQSAVDLPLGKEYQEWIGKQSEYAEKELKERVEKQKNQLINNISKNKGKIDAESLVLLNELSTLYPDDYWFNFIKNKNNE